MELTRSSASLTGNLSDILKSGILPLGIIVLVAMMVLPLPVFLLDVFFCFKYFDLSGDLNGSDAYL